MVEQGFEGSRRIVFPSPRPSDYRASVHNIAEHLLTLMHDGPLRRRMGQAGRERVKANYDYRVVARRFVELVSNKFGISQGTSMDATLATDVEGTKRAALEVLLHNARAGRSGLPRTAGWGYPEPYTRDLMIATLGIVSSGNQELIGAVHRTLLALAAGQSRLGQIASLADEASDLGASDTTPLFLIGLFAYRRVAHVPDFLEDAAAKAMRWMEYQSPGDNVIVAQQPTSDWRDEQWVLGHGLYVNTLVYTYLRLYGHHERAAPLQRELNAVPSTLERPDGRVDGPRPYYPLWSYKHFGSERYDLLGNSLAILSGIASRTKAETMIDWVESACHTMREAGTLHGALPPCLIPCIRPQDLDWQPRYRDFNNPGEYHNGGIWPFICGFYIASLVATGRQRLAEEKLAALTLLARCSLDPKVDFGFNEWIRAQDGRAGGVDWQTWSAAMYLYAVACVETQQTPLFDAVRAPHW